MGTKNHFDHIVNNCSETPVLRRVLGLSIGTVVLAIVIFMVWAKRQQELHAKKNRQQTWCWVNNIDWSWIPGQTVRDSPDWANNRWTRFEFDCWKQFACFILEQKIKKKFYKQINKKIWTIWTFWTLNFLFKIFRIGFNSHQPCFQMRFFVRA